MSPSRRARLYPAVALVLLIAGCSAPAPLTWDGNVVLIVIDTLRADAHPAYGAPREAAPFMAELAERSLVFERAWSTSSWTAPATASIFTGFHPNEHGVEAGMRATRNQNAEDSAQRLRQIPRAFETIPAFMQRRGYATFGVSGNPNVSSELGFDRGFDRFVMHPYAAGLDASTLTSQLTEWQDEIASAENFFLYVHYMDPHVPLHRQAQWLPPSAPPPPKLGIEDRVAYASEVRLVDEEIRRLFAALPLERAAVIVTSDHGQEFGEHGRYGHGFQLFSELTHVPLMIHVPGRPTGRVASNVSNLDVFATLRDLTGDADAEQHAGRSLLAEAGDAAPRSAFAMRTRAGNRMATKRAVVSQNWKLVVTQPDDRADLFDLAIDPTEQNSVATQHPDRVRALRALLEAQGAKADPTLFEWAEPIDNSPETRELLKALGYVEGGDS